jgi:hypothetical protein
MVNGVQQSPMEGTSMLYSFKEADAPERHDLQYFEMFANRGIYYKGWSAVTKHHTPWVMVGGKLPAFDEDVWELYDVTDYSQARNLVAERPEMLAKLQRSWPGMLAGLADPRMYRSPSACLTTLIASPVWYPPWGWSAWLSSGFRSAVLWGWSSAFRPAGFRTMAAASA